MFVKNLLYKGGPYEGQLVPGITINKFNYLFTFGIGYNKHSDYIYKIYLYGIIINRDGFGYSKEHTLHVIIINHTTHLIYNYLFIIALKVMERGKTVSNTVSLRKDGLSHHHITNTYVMSYTKTVNLSINPFTCGGLNLNYAHLS